MKNNILRTLCAMLIVFGTVLFVGCEKEITSEVSSFEFLSLDGSIDNYETLLNPENTSILVQATERVMSKVILDDAKLVLTKTNSTELAMSEDLFLHCKKHIIETNKLIEQQKILAFYNKNGVVELTNGVKEVKVRLRTLPVEGSNGKVNLNGMTNQQKLDALIKYIDSNPSGNLSDYFDMDNINWNSNSGSIAHLTGSGTSNGMSCSFVIFNNCWGTTGDCNGNDILGIEQDIMNGPGGPLGYQKKVKAATFGGSLITITYYY